MHSPSQFPHSIRDDTNIGAQKSALRRSTFARRRSLSAYECEEAGVACAQFISSLPMFTTSATVACYVSMGTEVNTLPVLQTLVHSNTTVFVPRLGSGLEIGWSAIDNTQLDSLAHVTARQSHTRLRPDEPHTAVLSASSLAHCDAIIVPALQVDVFGNRLGRGGGWYDRALLHRRENTPILAICWPWEITHTTLPHAPHDIAVNMIVTPDGITTIRKS